MRSPKYSASCCFETCDTSVARFPATALILGKTSRDPQAQAARLGQQFLTQNRHALTTFGVNANLHYDGLSVEIEIRTSSIVGAVPLISPATGKPEFGLLIHPRLEWQGVGEMLSLTGWRTVPEIVDLPLLPQTARNIPQWVLSAIVIPRLEALLHSLQRRFEFNEANLLAPRGQVDWNRYATQELPKMGFLRVPCRFPDLGDDRDLRAAIHFTLREQLSSLKTQRSAGFFVLRLIDRCLELIEQVAATTPRPPTPMQMALWMRRPMRSEGYRNGLRAMEWTVEGRGLAGLAEWEGLPWRLPMDQFFEAWVETIALALAPRIGASAKIARKRETVFPIAWEKPYLGSQKSLVPDLILQRENETIIIDAKYKEHWEDLQVDRWTDIDTQIRERHREDLLQVLAYSTLFSTPVVTTCLAYPCRTSTWESLKYSSRFHRRASIHSGTRQVNLVLTTLPMISTPERVLETLAEALKV